jgi:hypothetical protein
MATGMVRTWRAAWSLPASWLPEVWVCTHEPGAREPRNQDMRWWATLHCTRPREADIGLTAGERTTGTGGPDDSHNR